MVTLSCSDADAVSLASLPCRSSGRWSGPGIGYAGGGTLVAIEEAALGSGKSIRRRAGELEGEVLAALHAAEGPLTPSEVQDVLDCGLAYTTVMTILSRLHTKGLARRLPVRRGFAYCPTQSEAVSVARQMHGLLGVGADRRAVLAQFVDALEPAEEQLLEQLVGKRDDSGVE
jgi:predicted transcriptional regulator